MTARCCFEDKKILDPRSNDPSDNVEEKLVWESIHFLQKCFFLCGKRKGKMQMVKIERQEWKDTLRKRKEGGVL